jgi:hypothetical protein
MILCRLRPYEKFVQRFRGSWEEAGEEGIFSVSTSPRLIFLQRALRSLGEGGGAGGVGFFSAVRE